MSENPAMATARRILADAEAVGWSGPKALTHLVSVYIGRPGVWNRAEEIAWHTESEWRHIAGKLEALYARVSAGDDSVHTRERIGRLEAMQAALQGFPGALA
jgi:hypothetical protein